MSFKDDIKDDIATVFFETEEFADVKRFGDSMIHVVEDDDTLMRKYSSEFEALSSGSHMILVPIKELAKKPNVNDVIKYEGNLYTIDEVKYEMGVYVIFLNRGRG